MSAIKFVSMLGLCLLAATAAATMQTRRIPASWVGRYQATIVSATSGMDGDQTTVFGQQMYQTTIVLKTMACAQQFTMDISQDGAITGRGRLMYIYRGTAGNPVAAMAPAVGFGGFAVNLKDGRQYRDWTFSGTVTPDGEVEIRGIPDEMMDYINVNKPEKHRPWSALPPVDKNGMRGPFTMKLVEEKGRPTIRVDRFLQLDDALIRRVHYQTMIYRTDESVTPQCEFEEPPPAQCAASEYLKFKGSVGVDGAYQIETSKDLMTGASSTASKVGGDLTAGFSSDSSGGVGWEGGAGPLVGSTQFNPVDGSYAMTIGVGVNTGDLLPGPVKLEEKVELVYDSACGWGVKGSGNVKAGATGTGVEGTIFFTKGP